MLRIAMRVPGVEPEDGQGLRGGYIPLGSLAIQVGQDLDPHPREDGRRRCVSFTKRGDAASPDLFGLCASGQMFSEVVIRVGDEHALADAYTLSLSQARFDTFEMSVIDSSDELFESYALSATTMTIEFRGRVRKVRF